METLNTELVRQRIEDKGLKQIWVIQKTGLATTVGYQMLREGLLPKNEAKRKIALEKLAEILGVNQKDLILHLEAKTAS